MPKLEGIEPKQMFGLDVDKENSECFFNDKKHLYINKTDGSKYISVTTLIKQYEQPFLEDFWSKYKALEALMNTNEFEALKGPLKASKRWTDAILDKYKINRLDFENKVAEILESWRINKEEACEHGSYIHSLMENSFYNKTNFDFNRFGFGELSGNYLCNKNYYELDLENGVYPEFLMCCTSSDGQLRTAGQIDLLVKHGNDIVLVDWKTNKEIRKKGFYDSGLKKNQTMKYPLNEIQDSNYWHYALQLSCYGAMIQAIRPELNIKGLYIIHIARDGSETRYEVPYLKKEVIRMLNHYKKSIKIQQQLDKNKPIKLC